VETRAETVDVVIVGAGSAGLLAALTLLGERPGVSLRVVDAGLPLDDRRRAGPSLGGSGGAGLYLGGRLYVGPAAIPPISPVSMAPDARPIVSGAAYSELAHQVDALFTGLGATAPVRELPDERLREMIACAQAVGLEYVTSYPARFLSADERRHVLDGLFGELRRAGAEFIYGAHVADIRRVDDRFALSLRPAGGAEGASARLEGRALVLAPGRYGAEWLAGTVASLGAEVVALPSAFGVRLELPAAVYAPLTAINPDPRLQLPLASDAVVKTYATCPGGYVTPVTRYGRRVASGVPVPADARGPSTTVAVLVQPGVAGAASAWTGGEYAAQHVNERYHGTLAVQRMGDIRAGRATTARAMDANSVRPTYRDAVPGDVRGLYPEAFWQACDDLLDRIEQLAPGVRSDEVLAYAPAEERFWHFPTDGRMRTTVRGLFVAGDGPGHSQGIIQAGVAGTLAGRGAAAYLAERAGS
jgi:uncharacterized protein